MIWKLFQRRSNQSLKTRSSGSGFTAEIMAAREAYIAGRSGLAELTATAQSCITLWEGALSLADVTGTTFLTPSTMALCARSLALKGEAVFWISEEGLIPASDWELRTRNARPTAYRLSIPEAGGGRSFTALAAEVLHVRIGVDPAAPYYGTPPLRRASLTAGLLNAVESALGEVFATAPIGSQIVPMPETPSDELEKVARGFRGARGRVLVRESVNVAAAGGPAPQADWRPSDLTPDLERAMTPQTLEAARGAICMAFGLLPGTVSSNATGPLIREAQRHLAQWVLQPVAAAIAEEASDKLNSPITLDVMRPLQAYDAGGRARAAAGIIQALAQAKEAGVDPETAMKLVDWTD